MSKIIKRLIDLALARIIIDYGGWTTFAEAFVEHTIVEQCDRAFSQHDAIDLVSLLVYFSQSRKVSVAAVELAEAEVDKALYCWFSRQAGHAKKNSLIKQTQTQTVCNPKRKSIVTAKNLTKGAGNHVVSN